MGGTTRTSGWALFVFLIGYTVLGTSAIGSGVLGFIAGIGLLIGSGFLFKMAREKEGV